eukprot:1178400-Amorphochlora_amoeboformis.AAC.1
MPWSASSGPSCSSYRVLPPSAQSRDYVLVHPHCLCYLRTRNHVHIHQHNSYITIRNHEPNIWWVAIPRAPSRMPTAQAFQPDSGRNLPGNLPRWNQNLSRTGARHQPPDVHQSYPAKPMKNMVIGCFQISHHPPVSQYELFGPNQSWKLTGYNEYKVL